MTRYQVENVWKRYRTAKKPFVDKFGYETCSHQFDFTFVSQYAGEKDGLFLFIVAELCSFYKDGFYPNETDQEKIEFLLSLFEYVLIELERRMRK